MMKRSTKHGRYLHLLLRVQTICLLVACCAGLRSAVGAELQTEKQGRPFARWTWETPDANKFNNSVRPGRNDASPVNEPHVNKGIIQMEGGKTTDPADDRFLDVGELAQTLAGATYMQWTFLDLFLPKSSRAQGQVLAGSLQSGFGRGSTFIISASADQNDVADGGLADVSMSLFVLKDKAVKAESISVQMKDFVPIATLVGLRVTYAGAGPSEAKGTVSFEIRAAGEEHWTLAGRKEVGVGQINPSRATTPIRTFIGKYDPPSSLGSTFSVGEVAVSFTDPHRGERDFDFEIFSAASVPSAEAIPLDQHHLASGQVEQGIALTPKFYYGATSRELLRFDNNWQLIDSRKIVIEGVNHMGAIDFHKGFVWAGFLNHGKTDGKYDPSLNRSIIAKINPEKLEVVRTWDITADCTWIDPVCFDGTYLWVGEMHNLGIHRYRLAKGELQRAGVLRYPSEMSFSQGVRVRGKKLYTIHTFGSMDGLFEFDIPDELGDAVVQPVRVWPIQETVLHLEGFDFIPGTKDEIWHAQNSQVDRYRLDGIGVEIEQGPRGTDSEPR